MPFLNQQKGSACRNDFMINLHESYVTELGFELGTSGSAVRRASKSTYLDFS